MSVRTAYVFAGVVTAGLAVAVAGTFLPWLRSGTVERDSYQVAGVVDHFDLLDNVFATAALKSWIALPLLATGCVLLLVLRRLRTGAALAGALAIIVGTVSVLAAIQAGSADGGGALFGVTAAGPVTTAAGMTFVLCGALGVFVSARHHGATTTRSGMQR